MFYFLKNRHTHTHTHLNLSIKLSYTLTMILFFKKSSHMLLFIIYTILYINRVNHNDCILRFTMKDKLPTTTVIN